MPEIELLWWAGCPSHRRALAQLQSDRQTAAVALIQALGGGWTGI